MCGECKEVRLTKRIPLCLLPARDSKPRSSVSEADAMSTVPYMMREIDQRIFLFSSGASNSVGSFHPPIKPTVSRGANAIIL
jgi:hypothetical protein